MGQKDIYRGTFGKVNINKKQSKNFFLFLLLLFALFSVQFVEVSWGFLIVYFERKFSCVEKLNQKNSEKIYQLRNY